MPATLSRPCTGTSSEIQKNFSWPVRELTKIRQQSYDGFRQACAVLHLDRRLVLQERRSDLGKIFHVRPEDERLAVHGRLENVVPARRDQTAADEDDGRDLEQVRELSE